MADRSGSRTRDVPNYHFGQVDEDRAFGHRRQPAQPLFASTSSICVLRKLPSSLIQVLNSTKGSCWTFHYTASQPNFFWQRPHRETWIRQPEGDAAGDRWCKGRPLRLPNGQRRPTEHPHPGWEFGGTSWTLTSDTADLRSLSPNANDQMSSCRIQ